MISGADVSLIVQLFTGSVSQKPTGNPSCIFVQSLWLFPRDKETFVNIHLGRVGLRLGLG